MKKQVTFVTGNKGKLREMAAVLDPVVDMVSRDIDLLEIQGTAEEISREKCKLAVKEVKGNVECCLKRNGVVLKI